MAASYNSSVLTFHISIRVCPIVTVAVLSAGLSIRILKMIEKSRNDTPENNTLIARFSLAVPDKTHRNHNGDFDVDFIKIVAFNSLV